MLGVSTGDIFVCWGYLLVIYLCVGGIYRWYICVLGVSTGGIFVCWGYLLVIYLCVGGIYFASFYDFSIEFWDCSYCVIIIRFSFDYL